MRRHLNEIAANYSQLRIIFTSVRAPAETRLVVEPAYDLVLG
jgi:hypothetical protein